ncbi:hypothetical protein BLNAU_7378 [Blattamonas nauphoetae]|uniref:Uncharacterized protein n=1 Tax=Blattamonas nauphoetae TaxID=2049346 RepID=A0ABQ9Y1V2_9EUKA|nr:hypothetical protein BLNAU_7378 [Blattamonas nauphoetae]
MLPHMPSSPLPIFSPSLRCHTIHQLPSSPSLLTSNDPLPAASWSSLYTRRARSGPSFSPPKPQKVGGCSSVLPLPLSPFFILLNKGTQLLSSALRSTLIPC